MRLFPPSFTDRCRIALGVAKIVESRSNDGNGELCIFQHGSTDIMPSDATGEATLGAEDHCMKVRLVPSIRRHARHNSAHRITVCCDQCGSWVPSGRYYQHVGKGKCKHSVAHLAKVRSMLKLNVPAEGMDLESARKLADRLTYRTWGNDPRIAAAIVQQLDGHYRIVFSGGVNGDHSLAISCSSEARVMAHWSGYCEAKDDRIARRRENNQEVLRIIDRAAER